MHSRFDALLRRCKARKRKILLGRIALLSGLLLFVAAATYISGSGVSLLGTGENSVVKAPREAGGTPAAVLKEAVKVADKSQEIPKPIESKPDPKPKPETAATVDSGLQKSEMQTPEKVDAKVAVRKVKESAVSSEKENPKSQRVKPENEKSETKERRKVLLEIKEASDLSVLLEQYGNSPRYSTALKIAEIYYEKGDFEDASLWAKKANILDRDDERAWIIYAESEYALGREDRAKRILKLFLEYKDSVKARSLLMTWSRQ